jgi:predicted transcriptional regulator with HTH domain
MKGADDDLLAYIMSEPKSKLSFYKLWEDEKAKRGVDYSKDPAIEDAMFRNFAYTQAEKLLPHGLVTEEIAKTPVIRVSTGGGGAPPKTVDYDFIKNIQDSIQSNDISSLTSLADNLAGLRGGKFVYQSVVPYKRKDGTITGVQFNLQDEYGDIVTRTLKSGASNLRAQLVGLYQDITGSSSKAEKSLVGEKPKKETYKVGNQTFSKADLNKKGYTDDQIEQAIKLGTIIKQ